MDLTLLDNIPYFLKRWYGRVEENPDKVILVDGRTGETLTAGETEELSGRIYAYLKKAGIKANDFVMIDMPRGIHALVCMLGVWKAGAAFTVVEDDYAPDRIEYIRKNVNGKVFLDAALYEKIKKEEYEEGFIEADNHDASFAVYTSGTTGFPKGVLHEYGNIKINSLSSRAKTGRRVTSDSKYAMISPINFLASIKIVLTMVQLGFTLYVIPYDIAKNPLKLKQYFLENEMTISFLSPSMLRIIGNDLGPYMKYVFTGSEPANGISLDGITLINTYSMSEGAFTVAQFEVDRPYDVCPVGKPNSDEIIIHILDENDRDLPEGEVGEIAFENPFFRGYIGLKEESEKALRGGLYHTGDLGKKLPDGNLVLLGRSNDMIKINGNRIEPAEIEKVFKEVTGIPWCVAKGFEEKEQSFICLYYKGEIEPDETGLKEKMGKSLPYYMIPSYYVQVEEFPLLANGKINKKALEAPNREVYEVPYAAPETEIQILLCNCAAKVLGRERVGLDDDFYRMGGDSLKAMALLAEVNLDELTAADIFNGSSIRKIAAIYEERIKKSGGITSEEYEMRARKGEYPPFAAQTSFVDIQMYSPKHPVFNIPACYSFEDVSIAPKLKDALNEVIKNTPVFSSVFSFNEDCELVESVKEGSTKEVEICRVSEEEFAGIKKDFVSHFKRILGEPLCRFGIYVTEERGYLLALFHHGIIDGMGLQLFLRRLVTAYEGKKLPMDTFYTCLAREAELKGSDEYREAEKYMTETYGSADFSCNLDADMNDGENNMNMVFCKAVLTREQMDDFEARTGFTRNQFYEAVLLLAMARCNKKKNVMMAKAYHNRVDFATKNAIGPILRKVPAALKLDAYTDAEEMFRDLQKQSLNTIRYGIYEWVIMHERLFIDDYAALSYETSEITDGSAMGGIGLKSYPCSADDPYSPIRMFLQVMDTPKGITPILLYSGQFYSAKRIGEFQSAIDDSIRKLISAKSLKDLGTKDLLKS